MANRVGGFSYVLPCRATGEEGERKEGWAIVAPDNSATPTSALVYTNEKAASGGKGSRGR